jgi:hypothetical protein
MKNLFRSKGIAGTLAALGFFALALAASAYSLPQGITKTQVKALIKNKVPPAIAEALTGLKGVRVGSGACQAELDQAVAAAEREAAACLNPDNPPAGSPLANFNQMTNLQVTQFCGNLTGDECAEKILNDQKKFCAKERAKEIAKANNKKAACEAEIRQCNDARANLQNAKNRIVQLEKELANLKGELPTLESKATQVCR